MSISKIIQGSLASALALIVILEASAHPDLTRFSRTAFTSSPEMVTCSLENGVEARCYRITVGYLPQGLEIGPFCPATLDDQGGIWEWTGDKAGLYRVNRDFFIMLDDLGYRFFDEDGTIHIADIATAKPEDEHACINVSPDESVQITMLIPVNPIIAESPKNLGTVSKIGVALNGVPIFSDAPQIQQTGHMPALDLCGGHIDPGGWYHWHGTATDIKTTFEYEQVDAECSITQDPTAQFGYAFDGFEIFGSREADGSLPQGLDACNGHITKSDAGAENSYHYHSTPGFPNLPPCLVGVQAWDNFSTTATAGVGATRAGQDGRSEPPRPDRGGPPGMGPDLDAAAVKLGVSAELLGQSLHDAGGPNADLTVVAKALGVSEEKLRAALPPPVRR